jgi:metal-responsive CopG/Arc/MetJ family transcriptional regulator
MKMMSLKLPDDLLREVEEEARRTGLTKSQVIRRLVEEGMNYPAASGRGINKENILNIAASGGE